MNPLILLTLASTSTYSSALEWPHEMVVRVNDYRQRENLPPLKAHPNLMQASQSYAEFMASKEHYGHYGSDGSDPDGRAKASGFLQPVGENIAANQSDPQEVVIAWMNSTGHRKNILSKDYRYVGAGFSQNEKSKLYKRLWVMNYSWGDQGNPLIIDLDAYSTQDDTVDLYVYASKDAKDMRFRLGDGEWSEWTPYSPQSQFKLAGELGEKLIQSQVRSRSGKTVSSEDSIFWVPQVKK